MSTYSPVIQTRSADDSSLASEVQNREAFRDQWDNIIAYRLVEWGKHAQQGMQVDEFPGPTQASVRSAIEKVREWIGDGLDAADRITPNGDGGISFEWERGAVLYKTEALSDGQIQETLFDGPTLIWHSGF
jgi:hypothetical protein